MTSKMMLARHLRRPSDVGVMLALGVVLGPALIIDLVTHVQVGPP